MVGKTPKPESQEAWVQPHLCHSCQFCDLERRLYFRFLCCSVGVWEHISPAQSETQKPLQAQAGLGCRSKDTSPALSPGRVPSSHGSLVILLPQKCSPSQE